MWWRPAWFSLKGKGSIRGQRRGAVLPPPALSTNRPADPCTTAWSAPPKPTCQVSQIHERGNPLTAYSAQSRPHGLGGHMHPIIPSTLFSFLVAVSCALAQTTAPGAPGTVIGHPQSPESLFEWAC